jgi:nucleoside-diphosphate-sugar epimerase/acyl carrier protein
MVQTRFLFPSQAAWSHLLDENITLGLSGSKDGPMSVKEVATCLAEEIRSITQASSVLVTSPLVSLGLDSFGFVELGSRIQRQFNIDMNSIKLTPEQTIMEVAQIIVRLQKRTKEAVSCDASSGGEEVKDVDGAPLARSSAIMGAIMRSRFDADKEVRPASSLSTGILSAPLTLLASAKAPSAYLLFGATGLMGSHLLRYLIKGGAKKVYCVVRAATSDAAIARITKNMQELHIWKPKFAGAIVALPGDLLSGDFGLESSQYQDLRAKVAHVVHAAGSRAWRMDQVATDCNSKGVTNVVSFARRNGSTVHYVSSSWLDVYDAAVSEEDKAELEWLPYIGVKRLGEEIMCYAARNCGVRAYSYRVPLLSVNSKGGFSGDFVLFTTLQMMYKTGMALESKATWPLMTTDSAARFMVNQMRAVPFWTRGGALTCTALPYAELLPADKLRDIGKQLLPRTVERGGTIEAAFRSVAEVVPVQDMGDTTEFFFALGRASINLKAHARAKSLSEVIAIGLAKRKLKAPPSAYLQEYLRTRPEIITQGALVKVWETALARKKDEDDKAAAAHMVDKTSDREKSPTRPQ